MFRKSKNAEPGRYTLAGMRVECPHCGGSEFMAGEAQLNTALSTLIELDWADKTASILTCTSCGRIQWFAQAPARQS